MEKWFLKEDEIELPMSKRMKIMIFILGILALLTPLIMTILFSLIAYYMFPVEPPTSLIDFIYFFLPMFISPQFFLFLTLFFMFSGLTHILTIFIKKNKIILKFLFLFSLSLLLIWVLEVVFLIWESLDIFHKIFMIILILFYLYFIYYEIIAKKYRRTIKHIEYKGNLKDFIAKVNQWFKENSFDILISKDKRLTAIKKISFRDFTIFDLYLREVDNIIFIYGEFYLKNAVSRLEISLENGIRGFPIKRKGRKYMESFLRYIQT